MLFVSGRGRNLWAAGLGLSASTENPRLPVAGLADDDPTVPAAAADITSPWDIVLDARLGAFPDPHFDSAWTTAPPGWAKAGNGELVRDAATTSSGSGASCRFNDGSVSEPESVFVTRTGTVACGAVLDLSAAFRWEEAGELGGYVLCEDTGLYWSGDLAAWTSAEVPALRWSGPGAPPTGEWVTVSAPGIDLAHTDVARIRISLGVLVTSAKDCWVDDLRVLSRVDLWSVHQPHLLEGASLVLSTSPDASTWTERATLDPRLVETWVQLVAPVSARYWRLRAQNPKPLDHVLPTPWGFAGSPAIGESVLALAVRVVGTWTKVSDAWDHTQVRAGALDRHRIATAGGPQRRLVIERAGATAQALEDALTHLWRPALGGVRGALVVWDESRPDACVLGVLADTFASERAAGEPDTPHKIEINGYAPTIWLP